MTGPAAGTHRVAAVVPVIDEATAIGELTAGLRAAGACCVFVVDGGSRDGTADVARAAGGDRHRRASPRLRPGLPHRGGRGRSSTTRSWRSSTATARAIRVTSRRSSPPSTMPTSCSGPAPRGRSRLAPCRGTRGSATCWSPPCCAVGRAGAFAICRRSRSSAARRWRSSTSTTPGSAGPSSSSPAPCAHRACGSPRRRCGSADGAAVGARSRDRSGPRTPPVGG